MALRLTLLKRYLRRWVGQQRRAFYFAIESVKNKSSVFRPFNDVQESSPLFACDRAPVELIGIRAWFRSVNGRSVRLEPRTDFCEPGDAWLRDKSFGRRADIQQVIPVLADDVHELSN